MKKDMKQTKFSMKKVQFNNDVHNLLVPHEDRKGEIVLPLLNKRIKGQVN